jgi:hypothetical protein
VCTALPGDDADARLCVIGTESGAEWFVFGDGPLPRKLFKVPEISLSQVARLDLSPRYLAVISVGEGHPMLDILDWPAMREERLSEVVYSFNPYPHLLDSMGWQSSTHLGLELSRLSEEEALPAGLPACAGEKYTLELPAGTWRCATDQKP